MTNFDLYSQEILLDTEVRYQELLDRNIPLKNSVMGRVEKWCKTTKRHCELEFPYYDEVQSWSASRDISSDANSFNISVMAYKLLCQNSNSNYNTFWDQELLKFDPANQSSVLEKEVTRELEISYRLLDDEWQKLLDKLKLSWELEQIQLLRKKFIIKLFSDLDAINELTGCIQGLGFEPGVLFDLSTGSLNINNIAPIKRWLEYLKNDKGVQAITDLMGKVNQIKQSEKLELINHTITQTVKVPDINSREEIVGIRLGKDLEHALPSELALMADPDTSVLFDLKYLESGLMCFDLQGMQSVTHTHQTEVEETVMEDEIKGPMIICVDTSGSMKGAPETIAKAVTMLMVLKAQQHDRACYLINFSTSIETLDLSGGFAMRSLISFLQKSFYGGTDVAPAIRAGLEKMSTGDYRNADMLIISDFIMAGLPQTLLDEITTQREKGNKFNSLVVESCFMEHRLKSIFDNEWVYDPATSKVIELLNFQNNCSV